MLGFSPLPSAPAPTQFGAEAAATAAAAATRILRHLNRLRGRETDSDGSNRGPRGVEGNHAAIVSPLLLSDKCLDPSPTPTVSFPQPLIPREKAFRPASPESGQLGQT